MEVTNADERVAIARSVLADLPEWFGIPDNTDRYVAAAGDLDMIAAFVGNAVIGFLSLKARSRVAAEAYVLGVRRRYHRRGVGRSLFGAADRKLSGADVRYLTVKTLPASAPSVEYAVTRSFYEAIGFETLDVLEGLAGWDGSVLMMLRPVSGTPR